MKVPKTDLDKLAREVCWFGHIKGEQAPGLALLFRIVEREAFSAGVRTGRGASYAKDPDELYHEYAYVEGSPTGSRTAAINATEAEFHAIEDVPPAAPTTEPEEAF